MARAGKLRMGRSRELLPVLNDVTIELGALTVNGQGGVWLNSEMLGLVASNSGPINTFDVSAANADNTLWQGIAGSALPQTGLTNTAPAPYAAYTTNAWTPVPSATGAGASGLRTKVGTTYTFTITAYNAQGSDTATLSILIRASAASIGSWRGLNDNTPSTMIVSVASFESLGGNAIILTRGCDRGTNGLSLTQYAFTANVDVADADPAYPATLLKVAMNGTGAIYTSYLTIDLLTGGGINSVNMPTARYVMNSVHHITLTNPRAYAQKSNPALFSPVNPVYGIQLTGNVVGLPSYAIVVNDGYFTAHGGAFKDGSTAAGQVYDVTVNNLGARWVFDNGFYLSDMADATFTDCYILSNNVLGALHPDVVQRADEHAVDNVVFNRFLGLDAGGSGAQTFWHGGTGAGGPEKDFRVTNSLVTCDGQNALVWAGNQGTLGGATDVTVAVCPSDGTPETNAGSAIQWGTAPNWLANVTLTRTYIFGKKLEVNVPGGIVSVNTIYRDNSPVSTDFIDPDPETTLSSFTTAQWDAMTVDEIKALYIAAYTPTIGGALDLGGGVTIGAITLDGVLKS